MYRYTMVGSEKEAVCRPWLYNDDTILLVRLIDDCYTRILSKVEYRFIILNKILIREQVENKGPSVSNNFRNIPIGDAYDNIF
jgi:hypothetical protein